MPPYAPTSKNPINGPEWSIVGKYVVVTGSSDGIGKETALQLVLKGAHVALVGRSPDKTSRVADELLHLANQAKPTGTSTGLPAKVRPEVFIADLSKCAEVKRLASEIKSRLPRTDVLINNAGGYFEQRQMSEDGFEQTFALNHLSYFLLTHHLLDHLQSKDNAQREARIINVSSEAHRRIQIAWDDLQAESSYNSFRAYQRSKLANILFTNALARRLSGSSVSANSLHPGFVASKFGHNNSGLSGSIFRALQVFARTESKGAETSVYLATSPSVSRISGQYFIDCKPKAPAEPALDHEAQEKLWLMTEKILAPFL